MKTAQGNDFVHPAGGLGSKVWHHELGKAAMATCEWKAQHQECVGAVRAYVAEARAVVDTPASCVVWHLFESSCPEARPMKVVPQSVWKVGDWVAAQMAASAALFA